MDTRKIAASAIIASFLALAGCAASPEDELRRQEIEADIDDIVSQELDPAEYGEPRSCLRDSEIRRYRALGQRHILFEGRQGRFWVNELRGRCLGLNDDSVFIMEPNRAGRLCDMDRFGVVDRAGLLPGGYTAPTCGLGKFKPVTEQQVQEIENLLQMR